MALHVREVYRSSIEVLALQSSIQGEERDAQEPILNEYCITYAPTPLTLTPTNHNSLSETRLPQQLEVNKCSRLRASKSQSEFSLCRQI